MMQILSNLYEATFLYILYDFCILLALGVFFVFSLTFEMSMGICCLKDPFVCTCVCILDVIPGTKYIVHDWELQYRVSILTYLFYYRSQRSQRKCIMDRGQSLNLPQVLVLYQIVLSRRSVKINNMECKFLLIALSKELIIKVTSRNSAFQKLLDLASGHVLCTASFYLSSFFLHPLHQPLHTFSPWSL